MKSHQKCIRVEMVPNHFFNFSLDFPGFERILRSTIECSGNPIGQKRDEHFKPMSTWEFKQNSSCNYFESLICNLTLRRRQTSLTDHNSPLTEFGPQMDATEAPEFFPCEPSGWMQRNRYSGPTARLSGQRSHSPKHALKNNVLTPEKMSKL
jgi:hypothetical protein